MSLQFYLQDAASLLNDQSFSFTSQKQLIRWINLARSDIAKRTGCIQRLISGQSALGAGAQPGFMVPGAFQPGAVPSAQTSLVNPLAALNATMGPMMTITGVERYPYQGFFNPYVAANYAGIKGVIDALQIAITWSGDYRPALDWMAWDDFQARCRAIANQSTSYPCVWSVFNDGEEGEVWLYPTPSQAGEIELYATCMPTAIYSDSDPDAIPEEMRELVKWKAAEYAFMSKFRYQQAQMMEAKYLQQMGVSVVARDAGKVSSYYPTVF